MALQPDLFSLTAPKIPPNSPTASRLSSLYPFPSRSNVFFLSLHLCSSLDTLFIN